jgi:hypothetical protein
MFDLRIDILLQFVYYDVGTTWIIDPGFDLLCWYQWIIEMADLPS